MGLPQTDTRLTVGLSLCCLAILVITPSTNGLLPAFVNAPRSIKVAEDTSVGTSIGNLLLQNGNSLQIESKTPYVEVNETNRQANSLQVDIILKVSLDYENTEQQQLNLEFEGSDTSQSNGFRVWQSITLIVEDVNDVTPVFQNLPYALQLPEDTRSGKIVFQDIRAKDPDFAEMLTYNMMTNAQGADKDYRDKFTINAHTGDVTQNGALDFETNRFYQYTITVTDKVGHNSSAEFYITVLDRQDTPPFFTGQPFVATILENSILGKSILTVKAQDGDTGEPNSVRLNIAQDNCPGVFQINPNSGIISIKSSPDRDHGDILKQSGVCTVIVQATEGGEHTQISGTDNASTTVTITITDINDNAPKFSNSSYTATVDENAQKGSLITLNTPLTVTDIDQGNNAAFEISVTKLADYFEVTQPSAQSTATLLISVKNSTILDYETKQTLTIELKALDKSPTSGSVPRSSTAQVTLDIINLNDNNPSFAKNSFKGSIGEAAVKGTVFTQVTATDADSNLDNQNYGTVTYSLEGAQTDFMINRTTGEVWLSSGNLDRETKDLYYLTVVAEDGGNSKASAPLEIRVLDANDHPPQFLITDYQTSLNEKETSFSRAITVEASDKDEENTINSEIVYSIVSTSPQRLESHFRLDSANGSLNVITSLKYEKLKFLPGKDGQIEISVSATDKGSTPLSSTATVVVFLQDINDQVPKCDRSLYTAAFEENQKKSTIQVSASDEDGTAPNNVIMYMIDPQFADKFTINSSSGLLSLRETLDHESVEHYNVRVIVSDLGQPSLTSQCTVSIDVTDINDTPPVFRNVLMRTTEDELKHLTLNCSAEDEDLDAELEYEILWNKSVGQDGQGNSVSMSELQKWLEIKDKKKCLVTSRKVLDREKVSSFNVQIQATDIKATANKPQTATATFNIKVQDVNDNGPEFSSGRYTGHIEENMPVDSEIAFTKGVDLRVSDNDEGTNSNFNLTIQGYDFGVTPMSGSGSTSFKLFVKNASVLDFEVNQSLMFEIVAVESQTKDRRSNTATVTVAIINKNDNIPEFENASTTIYVEESLRPGNHVTTIEAKDADRGDFGIIFYSIPEKPAEFIINETTGEILTTESLDREKVPSYSFLVRAQDKGNFTSTTQCIVIVNDCNDEAPVFTRNKYTQDIDENQLKFLPPFFIEAYDGDAAGTLNSVIRYSIIKVMPPEAAPNITINLNTSEISLVSPLDYELLSNGVINLVVEAKDQGKPSQSATASVMIQVADVNDVSPVFRTMAYNAQIPENAVADSSVITVHAADGDVSRPNNQVTYRLDSLSAETFDISKQTGEITVKGKLDREKTPNYTLTISAIDGGQPILTSTAVVFVSITDINDSPPVISVMKDKVELNEDTLDPITSVTATDPDVNHHLQYSIVWAESSGVDGKGQYIEGDIFKKYIQIDPDSGEITPIKELDREVMQRFQLTVLVNDTKGEPGTMQEDKAIVKVTIKDKNDNAPTFVDGDEFTASIQENMPVGSEVKLVNVSALVIDDADEGENSKYNISLIDSKDFNIMPKQGQGRTVCVITVADSSSLDYEVNQNITLTVIATEYDTPEESSRNTTITILIQNENDNIPAFSGAPFKADITENSMTNTSVITVQAVDGDLGKYGELTYFIRDSTKTFDVDSKTGRVFSKASKIDREITPSYTVSVTAMDGGNFTATTQLVITVTDKNDNPPIFTKDVYKIKVAEESSLLPLDAFVQATDTDEPNSANSKITYRVVNNQIQPQSSFSVDPNTGQLKLDKTLDLEKLDPSLNGSFIIEVQATDHGRPPQVANASVQVTVHDVNDNAPQFKHGSYNRQIEENSYPGLPVVTVLATDGDVSSSNKHVTYRLDTLSAETFDIDKETGNITVKGELDREKTSSYKLTVTASDDGQPVKTSTAVVFVNITDVNDSPPVISVIKDEIEMTENTCDPIVNMTATDPDVNHHLQYSIVWAESSGVDGKGQYIEGDIFKKYIQIDPDSGEIKPIKELDREVMQRFQLTVLVNDANGEPGTMQEDKAIVKVTIKDKNDNAPTFVDGDEFTASIQENMPVGSEVKLVNVSALVIYDADEGENSKYNISLIDSKDFNIMPKQGQGRTVCVITVADSSSLDYEVNQNITLTVIATECDTPEESSRNTTITILIQNENDNIPAFSGAPFKADITENSMTNISVITVQAEDDDLGKYGELTYFIRDSTKTFDVDSKTGRVFSKASKIDREITPSYTVSVTAMDGGNFTATTQLVITVTDRNDNPPIFTKDVYKIKVAEESSLLPLDAFVQATDIDEPNSANSKITYRVVNNQIQPQSSFSVDPNTGQLKLDKTLDLEKLDPSLNGSFIIEVQATDHGRPPQVANASVQVTVHDVNDNAPQFKYGNYNRQIEENSCPGLPVVTVLATDGDISSSNNRVTYRLDTLSAETFDIDKETGNITVKGELDREKTSSYKLTVTASDDGQPVKTSTAVVFVNITDVNDSPPVISVIKDEIEMTENTCDPIVNMTATDPDVNHLLQYSIVWAESSGVDGKGQYIEGDIFKKYITIDQEKGEVRPIQDLDREAMKRFQLTVRVNDSNGEPGTMQEDKTSVKVSIKDVNDHAPTFTDGDEFTASIQENMPEGSEIKLLNVSTIIIDDADEGDNSVYNISIAGTSGFTVEPTQARGSTPCYITVSDPAVLDFEKRKGITLQVIAVESNTPERKNSTATVTVNIINVNDNFPLFNASSFEASVPENGQPGDPITSLTASDADLEEYGIVHYFIDGDQTRFIIDKTTGQVSLNTSDLDREKRDSYTITVKARDDGDFEGSTQLTVHVTDVNDEIPKFDANSYSVEIVEDQLSFKSPLSLKVRDEDEYNTNNSRISYSISNIPKEFADIFRMDSDLGHLTLSSKLDYENVTKQGFINGQIQFEVKAADWGDPPLNSAAVINVTVLDVNDNSPNFIQQLYSGYVKENAAEGTSVATVQATDEDGTKPNNEIYYVIKSGGEDKFQINSSSGDISVGIGAHLDLESMDKNSFALTVLAVDRGSPSKTATTTVSVTVEDVNDTPPQVEPITEPVKLYENAPIGDQVVNITATDPDQDHSLLYTLLWTESLALDEKEKNINTSSIQTWFDINSTTGVIFVGQKLDRETVEQVILKVHITDIKAYNTPQEATATVTITLLDVNDNPPVIVGSGNMLVLNVSEGTKENTEVTTLIATDEDKDQTVKFSVDTAASSFSITDSGKLFLSKALDREMEPSTTLIIKATDSGSPPLTSSITVQVQVLDTNDNDPKFVGIQTTYSVPENSAIGTVVAQMNARDSDEGDNANVTFAFKDFPPFRIDALNGTIFVTEKLDREQHSSYSLTVIAADNPSLEQRRRNSTVIEIVITDTNDNSPEFPKDVSGYHGEISEIKTNGSQVILSPHLISATDDDTGENARISYFLQDPTVDYFSIDPDTGLVHVAITNLRNLSDVYQFTVNATDHGTPPKSSVANLTIKILDENLNAPKFVSVGPIGAVPECINADVSVYTFSATDDDKDKDTNGKVKYYLNNRTSTDHWKLFNLDSDTGVLSTKESLLKLNNLVIQIRAQDMGKPSLSTLSSLLHVQVTDINDNPPEFDSEKNTNFSVAEGQNNAAIGSVKASDPDYNSTLEYLIKDGDADWKDYFAIMRDSAGAGVISTIKPLDRESHSFYKLKVQATDITSIPPGLACGILDLNPMMSATIDVTVTVTDVNDNPPVFHESSLTIGFLSSTDFGKTIVRLTDHISDNDTAPNNVHHFYQVGQLVADEQLSKGWSPSISPEPIKVDVNGSLLTNFKFREDTYGMFSLKILANDSAGSDTLDLKVYVVGDFQVVHMTVYYTEDQLRTKKMELSQQLSRLGYHVIPDNILPYRGEDDSIDGSKSVMVVHAVDDNGNIITGKTLLHALDTSSASAKILNSFKILKTESGDALGQKAADTSDKRTQFILIAIIAVIALTFVITLYMLIHNIRRFKRKLKAATLEVHGMDNIKQDTFPGLDNEGIKSANPIFMRDDISLGDSKMGANEHYDSLSQNSNNSLDQNAVGDTDPGMRRGPPVTDEQEVTMDMYNQEDPENRPAVFNFSNLGYDDDEDSVGETDHHRHDRQHIMSDEGDDPNAIYSFDRSNIESTEI